MIWPARPRTCAACGPACPARAAPRVVGGAPCPARTTRARGQRGCLHTMAMRACLHACIRRGHAGLLACMHTTWPCGPACLLVYKCIRWPCGPARLRRDRPGPTRPSRFDFIRPGPAPRRRVEVGVLNAFWWFRTRTGPGPARAGRPDPPGSAWAILGPRPVIVYGPSSLTSSGGSGPDPGPARTYGPGPAQPVRLALCGPGDTPSCESPRGQCDAVHPGPRSAGQPRPPPDPRP